MKTVLLSVLGFVSLILLLSTSTLQAQFDSNTIAIDENNILWYNGEPQVTLAAYLDNRDQQLLSKEGNMLRIDNGGEVDLAGYMDNTDEQTIGMELDGTKILATISNGNTATLNIESITDEVNSRVKALEILVDRLASRVEALEGCACEARSEGNSQTRNSETPNTAKGGPSAPIKSVNSDKSGEAKLYQNIPNPFQATSSIKYFVPENAKSATIQFSNTSGQVVSKVNLENKGNAELDVNGADLKSGVYLYTLYVDGNVISTRKMVIK